MSKIRRPKLIIESIVKTREAGPKKFEESDIELFVEAVFEDADEADEVIIEETVVDSIIETVLEDADEEADEAIIDKIAGGEAVHDKTAGEIVAILDKIAGGGEAVRDKTAGEIEAILEAVERVDEFIVEPPVEAILEAAERVDEFIVEPPVEAVREAAERSRRTRGRI